MDEKNRIQFPVETEKIKLKAFNEECMKPEIGNELWYPTGGEMNLGIPKVLVSKMVPDRVKLRYDFSNYLIDPNKFRLRKVIRVMSIVLLFIATIKKGSPSRGLEPIEEQQEVPREFSNKNITVHDALIKNTKPC